MKLRQYQVDAIDFISKHRGSGLICIPAGGGKTATVLYLRKKYPMLKKVLIVCPASIKEQWKQNVLNVFPDEKVCTLYGTYDKSSIQEVIDSDVVIVNFDILSLKSKNGGDWKDFLHRLSWDLGVIDESHFCASKDSNRTKAVKYIFLNIPHRVLLSGTPLLSNVESLYSQFNIIAPLEWDSHSKFMQRYCPIVITRQIVSGGRTITSYKPSKPQNLDELKDRMTQCCFLVSKEEVYSHLPAVTETVIPCKVSDKSINAVVDKIMKSKINTYSEQKEAEQLLNTSRQMIGKAKVKFCVEFVKDLLTTDDSRKIVVFTHHREVTEETAKAFGEGVATIFYGGMSTESKQEAIQKFLNDDKCKVIVMNSSAVTGVDSIQKKANTCVWLELPSTSYVEEQATGRIRRVNSGKWFDKFFSYFVKSDTPVDDAILSVLADRRAVVKAVMTDGEIVKEEESSAIEIIKKIKGI